MDSPLQHLGTSAGVIVNNELISPMPYVSIHDSCNVAHLDLLM